MIDSHCHPQFPQYDKDRDEMIKRALDGDVQMICVGTDLETSKKAIELAQKYDGVWASVGLHPNDTSDQFTPLLPARAGFAVDNFQSLLEESKVVAVGEIGLDYYRTTETQKQEEQRETFLKFLELANKTGKPLILHCRDAQAGSMGRAYGDMIEILDSKIRGVVHSYTGSLEEANQFLNLGLCLGFNGIITFARQYDEIVKYVPLDRILLETDAPYLTPEPYRGKRNEPSYIIEVAQRIAELKGVSFEKVVEQTTKNCCNLFDLI